MVFPLFAAKSKTRQHPKSKFSPPGTIWLKEDVFLDQTEISNFSWLEYISWLKKNDRKRYDSALPDTNLWIHPEFSHFPFEQFYLRHPAYRNYPVVGVSYKQVSEYCVWRTKMVNHYISVKLKKKKFEDPIDSNAVQYVTYRLPRSEEWEYAAYGELNRNQFPYGVSYLTDPKTGASVSWTKENRYLAQRFPNKEEEPATCMVAKGIPNAFGYFHLIGNVSEWLADSTAIGLNFNDFLRNEKNYPNPVNTTRSQTKADLTVGFRCICEVKKFPW